MSIQCEGDLNMTALNIYVTYKLKRLLFLVILLPLALNAQTKEMKTDQPGDSIKASKEKWFDVIELSSGVWRINDNGRNNIYLVEGSTRALLIDAGIGAADLKACVESITDLPVTVVNTHGHPDHCGSNYQFDTVYASSKDFEMISFFNTRHYHSGTLESTRKEAPGFLEFILDDVDDMKQASLVPVEEGYVFDLGDRRLKVISAPGHTEGSICLLDVNNKLLFTGDNNNKLVWLFLEGCLPLEEYVKTLQKLKRLAVDFYVMLPGHGDPLENEFLDKLIACGNNVLSGECEGVPYKTFVDYAKVCSFEGASIAFNPDNLFSGK